jgi:hypothetical protein
MVFCIEDKWYHELIFSFLCVAIRPLGRPCEILLLSHRIIPISPPNSLSDSKLRILLTASLIISTELDWRTPQSSTIGEFLMMSQAVKLVNTLIKRWQPSLQCWCGSTTGNWTAVSLSLTSNNLILAQHSIYPASHFID